MIIWLASYPKSGNTWMRTIINEIFFNEKNIKEEVFSNLEKNIDIYPKINHFLNLTSSLKNINDFQNREEIIKNWINSQQRINADKRLRFYKTHNYLCSYTVNGIKYNFTDLKNTLGVIHIVRDPRNVITSLKNHFFFKSYEETLNMMKDEHWWIGLSEKEVPQALSSWQQHYLSWSSFPNNYILFKYEDLLNDTKNQIKRLIVYLKKFTKFEINEKRIDRIIENTSFSNLKKLENEGMFKEKAINLKTKEERNFFYLGPKNNFSDFLDKKIKYNVEKNFKKAMFKLNYI